MASGLDMMSIMNIALCVAILALGCWGYLKTRNKAPFHISIAFGLFAISHLITFLGMERDLWVTMTLIRIFGYLIVLFALYNLAFEK